MNDFEKKGNHTPGNPELGKKQRELPLQEMLFVAEAATRGGMKALPGKEWSLHYPQGLEHRNEKLQGLLEGRYQPIEVAPYLQPDAIVYDIQDLEKLGVDAVSARVSEASIYQQHFDYQRFAEFVASMRGKNIPLDTLQKSYDGVARSRVQKRVYDAFGSSGQSRMADAFQAEVAQTESHWSQLTQTERVLTSLKQNWLTEDLGVIDPHTRDLTTQLLSPDEKILFDQMKEPFRKFIQQGDEVGYRELVSIISDQFPNIIPQHNQSGEMSQEMQDLNKELEAFRDQVGPPGSNQDPGISQEDQDEYDPPPPQGVGKEGEGGSTVFYEIIPPLGGYYAKGRKSYYDIDRKIWSKRKQLTPYTVQLSGGNDSHTISGTVGSALIAVPLPKTFAIDCSSLRTTGAHINFFRDQNGCFYLQASGPCKFEVDFFKEQQPFLETTIQEDLEPMYRGNLSQDTENTIRLLRGSNVQKAKQAQSYIHTHHYYPGGGDLNAAQALQYKLKQQSTGDNYLQNIDLSEYLECYSSNTLFCAILRKAGVPVRLVTGHRVQGARDGKSEINSSTGHAWSEVWDGTQWVRFDATPPAKLEDMKKDDQPQDQQNQGKQESAPEADDGAADNSPPPQQGSQDQQGQQMEQSGEPSGQQNMPEASDEEVQNGQKELDRAKEELEKMEKEQQELQKKISDAKTFDELEKIKKEIEAAELLDKMENSLEEKIDAKQEQLKNEMEDDLDQMTDDGFMDEDRRQEITDQMEDADSEDLERIRKQIERERISFDQYEALREEVAPYVDEWWEYFANRLPKEEDVDNDEDALTRSGRLNKKSVQKYRNLMLGRVKNPRMTIDSIKPRFIATVLIDTSGSMEGRKMHQATLLLVFYNELFSRISKEYGYIRYSNATFSDSVSEIKGFDQDYNSPTRYDFGDGTSPTTVKVRLMQSINASGGTDMLRAVKKEGTDLDEQVRNFPNHASALYFIGDGGDTEGNTEKIKKFLEETDRETGGFGTHMKSAIMLGNEQQRQAISQVFGDESTRVANDFETLIEESMLKFEEDITEYFDTLS